MKRLTAVFLMILCLIPFSAFAEDTTEPLSPPVSGNGLSDADPSACLLGTWYFETDENGGIFGVAMTFAGGGILTLRFIDPASFQYEEETEAQYRVNGDRLILEANGETADCAFAVTEDELRIVPSGMEQTVFRKLSGEALDRMASMQPKYQPADVSRAVISYGTSAHFTHEQMDAAIAVIIDRFRTWYGCELHSIDYTSDERSAGEYQYYAGTETQKTGRNYTDGIVFASSFHTPPEDQEYPGSGLNPDTEFNGWAWILLFSETGGWELVDWGY